MPHVTSASLAGIGRAAPEGGQFAEARALQESLIAEVFAADVLVLGLPLYNFGMPSTLKSWFDYVARAGTTFHDTANGPEGLVTGKKAIVAQARAGAYDDASGFPFAVAHTTALLGFIGITAVEVVTAEGLAFGPDAAAVALDDLLADGQAYAGAGKLVSPVQALEDKKNTVFILRLYAYAVVFHGE